jgi:hypothetical protein
MKLKSGWKKYLEIIDELKELESIYRELRHAFRREGWTEKDLEKPPYYPRDIMRNFQRFSDEHTKVFHLLKDYFDIEDFNEYADYLKEKLRIIDLEIPLKDGDTERNNSRDEDN